MSKSNVTNIDTAEPGDRYTSLTDREDKGYRTTHTAGHAGRPFGLTPRACYFAELGDSPSLEAGDRAGAKRFLMRLEVVIDRGGWSTSERNRLYRLRDKWQRRAAGTDPRFMIAGTKPGRLSAEQEYDLARVKRRQAKATPARVDKRRKVYDFTEFDIDEPGTAVPQGYAKGGPDRDDVGGADLDGNAGDDEVGAPPVHGRPLTDKDLIVPGTDTKGHSNRLQCRVMPAHFRALKAMYDSKLFPFRTIGDIVRWSIHRGLHELQEIKHNGKIASHLLQVAAIHEVIAEEMAQAEFVTVFDAMAQAITKHIQDQAIGEARRVTAMVKWKIEQMPEGYWRDKYLAQLRARFGYLLDSATVEGVKLA